VATVGFFGKVPSRGDFVRRNLPASFTGAWDDWLQAGIAGSREVLGDAWLEIYLTSPAWRFALAADLVGDAAAAGVLIPSVDGVGRYFPLTLACVLDGAPTPLLLRTQPAWFERAEALARAALAEGSSFDELVAGLGKLGCPAPGGLAALGDAVRQSGRSETQLALSMIQRFAPPHALFWTEGSACVAPTLLFMRQLPTPRQFAALLDGAWSEHGWREGDT
jgi:type VI secretion system protein ImpM